MRESRKSIRLFENELLERLSHVHPITPLIVWVPVVLYFGYRSFSQDELSLSQFLGWGALGFFFWTLTEYCLHRYIFHFQGKSALSQRLHFIIHGNHHADPQDPTRLVMPPVAGMILAVILYWIFRLTLGAVWVDPFFAFFLVGYLCYDYIHYGVHHFNPRSKIGRRIKQSHMLHHFQSHDLHWGVSSPIWDHVFGTASEPKRPTRRLHERQPENSVL